MIGLADRKTLDIAQRVSAAGRSFVTPSVFLGEVCGVIAEAFEFDSVGAVRYHADSEEVSEMAFAGAPPADRAGRRPIAGVPLLVEARVTRNLVLAPAESAISAFALPLISADGHRCLAFLCGTRAATASAQTDSEALWAVGVVAATLLENALVREEMQERDMLKGEFVALAAHELRTPLATIFGISETLTDRGEELAEPERLALRGSLREQTTRVRNLVDQLLDLSRLDLGAIQISPEPLRLRPMIEELVRTLANGGGNAVTIAVPPELEAVVDPVALDRMLSNLIANSLRHGKAPVTITAGEQDRHLRLAVEDRGAGVPREFVPHLFDRFARASAGRADGSGLGLAISQAYARSHGGEIVYEPAVPHGARFEVVIPLRSYGVERPRTEPPAAAVGRRQGVDRGGVASHLGEETAGC